MNIENKTMEKVILAVDGRANYTSKIAHKVDMTYSHILRTVDHLAHKGILEKENKSGRIIIISLTKKGKRVRDAYLELNAAFSS